MRSALSSSAAGGSSARSYGSGRLLLTDQQRKRRWPRALCKCLRRAGLLVAPGGTGLGGGNSRAGGARDEGPRCAGSDARGPTILTCRDGLCARSGERRPGLSPEDDRRPAWMAPERCAGPQGLGARMVSSRPLTTPISRGRCPPLLGSASALARAAGFPRAEELAARRQPRSAPVALASSVGGGSAHSGSNSGPEQAPRPHARTSLRRSSRSRRRHRRHDLHPGGHLSPVDGDPLIRCCSSRGSATQARREQAITGTTAAATDLRARADEEGVAARTAWPRPAPAPPGSAPRRSRAARPSASASSPRRAPPRAASPRRCASALGHEAEAAAHSPGDPGRGVWPRTSPPSCSGGRCDRASRASSGSCASPASPLAPSSV